MSLVRWFWASDRHGPHSIWMSTVAVGLAWRGTLWAFAVPYWARLAVGIPISAVALGSFTAWLVLYGRDAARLLRARRVRRATSEE